MMADISQLSEQLHKLNVNHGMPERPRNVFPNSVIVPTPNAQTPSGIITSKPSTKSTRDINPFYDPNLTLEAAARYLFNIFQAALAASNAWLKVPVDLVRSVADAPENENPFLRMCCDFNHILFFLEHGRGGWDLTFLPDNFFTDVEALLPNLLFKVEGVSEIEGCDFIFESGVVPLRDVHAKLSGIEKLRKGSWRKTKEVHERQQDAESVARSSEAGNGDSVPLSLRPKIDTSRATKPDDVQFDGDVDLSFGNKTKFDAGGGEVAVGGVKSDDEVDIALGQECEFNAGKDALPTADLHHEVEGDVKQTEQDYSEGEAINPEFMLFVDEYEEHVPDDGDAEEEPSPEPIEDETKTENGRTTVMITQGEHKGLLAFVDLSGTQQGFP